MTSPAEYRQLVNECIQSARATASDPIRKQFLELAKLWMTAAERMEAGSSSSSKAEKGDGHDKGDGHEKGDGYAVPSGSTLERK